MLIAATTIPEDGLKLLLLAACGIGLLALGRWSSRLGGGARDALPVDTSIPDVKDLLSNNAPAWPPSAEEIAASFPFDPQLGKLIIRKFFFKKVDAIPGPADPDVFADELNVQLYDPDSGHTWWQSYFVATPKGLAQILREKSWRYLHAPDMLVLPRYDLEEIRRAVVSRIMADHDYFKGREEMKEAEEESL